MNVYFAEFLGTAILILFGGGVCANVNLTKSAAKGADWIVITVGWALAVVMGVYAVGQYTGAHLNPAVTLAIAMNDGVSWSVVPGYMVSQIAGGAVGATLVWLAFLPHWKQTEDAGTKLGVFSTAPAIKNYFTNFLTEIIGTMILIMGLLFIGMNKFSEGLNPLVVGALILAIGVSLGGPTGYAINPARDLGPRIAHALLPIAGKGKSNWGYAIVPILGPIAGGMLGACLYRLFYKNIFDTMSIVAIVVVVLTLLLGVLLNKTSKAKNIVSIY